ncbi:MAG: hypothetical protein M1822_008865 [Bathelium mastoideum]|nr:MAG: hypothetical protein M1822_008865 [Bathelium mastoideum]
MADIHSDASTPSSLQQGAANPGGAIPSRLMTIVTSLQASVEELHAQDAELMRVLWDIQVQQTAAQSQWMTDVNERLDDMHQTVAANMAAIQRIGDQVQELQRQVQQAERVTETLNQRSRTQNLTNHFHMSLAQKYDFLQLNVEGLKGEVDAKMMQIENRASQNISSYYQDVANFKANMTNIVTGLVTDVAEIKAALVMRKRK